MNDQEILQKLGLEGMPKEVQDQTLLQVNQIVEMRLAGMFDELMTEEQRAQFTKKSQEGPEAAWKWLSEELTDAAQLYQAALSDYLTEVTTRGK